MCEKKRFTKHKAIEALRHIKKRQRYRKERRYYHCKVCDSYHLTKRGDDLI